MTNKEVPSAKTNEVLWRHVAHPASHHRVADNAPRHVPGIEAQPRVVADASRSYEPHGSVCKLARS